MTDESQDRIPRISRLRKLQLSKAGKFYTHYDPADLPVVEGEPYKSIEQVQQEYLDGELDDRQLERHLQAAMETRENEEVERLLEDDERINSHYEQDAPWFLAFVFITIVSLGLIGWGLLP